MYSKNKMEVMLDLETLSTRNHAVILVIAAVKFNRYAPSNPLEEMPQFYRRIDINSCREVGMHTDEQTLKWWREQPKEIYNEAFGSSRIPLKQALEEFSQWFKGSDLIWSQGATFDIPILSEAYVRCGMATPWKFWNARDTRTIYDLGNVKSKDLPQENAHHALYDCWRQVWGVKKSFKNIKQF